MTPNLSPRLVEHLAQAGHEVVHVADVGLLAASDLAIAAYAESNDQVIVTSDSDFGTILARTGGANPSVVLLRHHNDASPKR